MCTVVWQILAGEATFGTWPLNGWLECVSYCVGAASAWVLQLELLGVYVDVHERPGLWLS